MSKLLDTTFVIMFICVSISALVISYSFYKLVSVDDNNHCVVDIVD